MTRATKGRVRKSGHAQWGVGVLALLAAVGAGTAAGENRTGWHGETLPAGMERSDVEGEYVWKKDGAIMVYVPPGAFPMGSEEGASDEVPVHEVYLDGFYIDKHEVTWAQWKATGFSFSEHPGSRLPEPSAPDWGILDGHPLLNTTWNDAKKYAAWAGKRLPTEAEWEKAARGTDGRAYPWGDAPPDFDRAVWREHPMAQESTAPVDCCAAGASPYGALNMAGNVYEWVEDTYDPRYYQRSPKRNPVNREEGPYRVLRGGAFVLEKDTLRSAYRYRLLDIDRAPYIGFRTAVSGGGAPGEAESEERETDQEDTP